MNVGRFATAGGVLLGGKLFTWFGNDYSSVGASFATVFAIGILVAFVIPTSSESVSVSTGISPDAKRLVPS
jgi:hypothetical protein